MANVIINDTNLTNIANAIREKNGLTDTYKPSEMAGAILAIETGGGSVEVEPIVLTGNCNSACVGQMADVYLKTFGNTVSTSEITSAKYMFQNSALTKIPFDINCADSVDLSYLFYEATNLTEAPIINASGDITAIGSVFDNAYNLRVISDEAVASWDLSVYLNYSGRNGIAMFRNCYSLRRIPDNILNNMRGGQAYYYAFEWEAFKNCYVLDEIVGLGVSGTYTTNIFNSTFNNCYRLKRMTFAMQEDGTPYTANWKGVTIDLSSKVGYANSTSAITAYNSGLDETTQVKANTVMTDEEKLAIIEQYPDDWWTVLPSWSRYDHDSAVETINSLPDTSEYLAANSGTNTIKFYSASGTSTPAGAINTLTEEEIAVATAKGWTVTLV